MGGNPVGKAERIEAMRRIGRDGQASAGLAKDWRAFIEDRLKSSRLRRKPGRQPANPTADNRKPRHRPKAPGLMMLSGSSSAFNACNNPSSRRIA